jgi:PhnB protein
MALEPFVSFKGNCREAVDFYAKVFGTAAPKFMTYGDGPHDDDMGLSDADKGLIMYTDLNIFGVQVMFCDTLPGMPFIAGNNISLTLITKDEDEIRRLFRDLGDGGEVGMELQETFWSNLYGAVTDKFGINWQLSHDSGKLVMGG